MGGMTDPELDPENYDENCEWIDANGRGIDYDPAADWTDSHRWDG